MKKKIKNASKSREDVDSVSFVEELLFKKTFQSNGEIFFFLKDKIRATADSVSAEDVRVDRRSIGFCFRRLLTLARRPWLRGASTARRSTCRRRSSGSSSTCRSSGSKKSKKKKNQCTTHTHTHARTHTHEHRRTSRVETTAANGNVLFVGRSQKIESLSKRTALKSRETESDGLSVANEPNGGRRRFSRVALLLPPPPLSFYLSTIFFGFFCVGRFLFRPTPSSLLLQGDWLLRRPPSTAPHPPPTPRPLSRPSFPKKKKPLGSPLQTLPLECDLLENSVCNSSRVFFNNDESWVNEKKLVDDLHGSSNRTESVEPTRSARDKKNERKKNPRKTPKIQKKNLLKKRTRLEGESRRVPSTADRPLNHPPTHPLSTHCEGGVGGWVGGVVRGRGRG